MTNADRRGLTPLFWSNVALHGTFELDMTKRLDYDRGPRPAPPGPTGEPAPVPPEPVGPDR
jgi:hypothetical protein